MNYKSDCLAQALFEAKSTNDKLKVNLYSLRKIQNKLQEALDLIEDLDKDTHKALDNKKLEEDLLDYAMEINATIMKYKEG